MPDTKTFNPWLGRVFTGVPALMLTASSVMKLAGVADVVKMLNGQLGAPVATIAPIGVLELLCVLLYVVPKTAVLGAVLLTGYLGGAVAIHVRAGEFSPAPLVLGVMVWAGLYFQDARVRALMPLRADG